MVRTLRALSLPLLTIPLLVTACARSEDASYVPPDSNMGYNQVGKVRTPEADDREPAIGQWRASVQEERPALEFGPLGTEPVFSLLCSGNGAVLLQRHGGVPAGRLPAMQITIGEATETLQPTAGGGTIPMMRAEVAAGSPLMAALATAGQPIVVRLADGTPLIMPPSPLVASYVQTCGRGGAPAPLGNQVAGNVTAPTTNGAAAAAGNGAQQQ